MITPLTYGRLVRDARLARGMSQYRLWKKLKEAFGENAICLATLKKAELDKCQAEARTKSQIARVLPETR